MAGESAQRKSEKKRGQKTEKGERKGGRRPRRWEKKRV